MEIEACAVVPRFSEGACQDLQRLLPLTTVESKLIPDATQLFSELNKTASTSQY